MHPKLGLLLHGKIQGHLKDKVPQKKKFRTAVKHDNQFKNQT